KRLPPSAEMTSAWFKSCRSGSARPRLVLSSPLRRTILAVNESQPASADVNASLLTAVQEDVLVRAARFFESVRQHRHVREVTAVEQVQHGFAGHSAILTRHRIEFQRRALCY